MSFKRWRLFQIAQYEDTGTFRLLYSRRRSGVFILDNSKVITIIKRAPIFMDITSARTYNLYMPRIDCLMSNHLHIMAVPDREVSMGKVFK